MTFAAIAPPLLFAVFVWWFSTGAILWLGRLPRATFAWSFGAVSLVAAAALYGLVASANDASAEGAYLAFACTIALWGWHEMSFLMGFIVGPRHTECPEGAQGWRRFKFATATLIHHEIALALTVVALVAFTWGQPNQVGAIAFLLLWALRLSAKLNLFLGAPYRSEELLPPHLAHLKSYFRHRRMNALFPVSIVAGAALAAVLGASALAADATPHQQIGASLLFALLALGLLEHVFLFVPPPNAMLWGWATKPTTPSSHPPTRTERLSATASID